MTINNNFDYIKHYIYIVAITLSFFFIISLAHESYSQTCPDNSVGPACTTTKFTDPNYICPIGGHTNHPCNFSDRCADAIDNEGNGLIDHQDSGCPSGDTPLTKKKTTTEDPNKKKPAEDPKKKVKDPKKKSPCDVLSSSFDYNKLRDGKWNDPRINSALKNSDSLLQNIDESSGKVKYDNYETKVNKMPPGLTPEQYLNEMLTDLNKAINNKDFNDVNIFEPRNPTSGPPQIGSIIDIDMKWFDNGSVMLVDRTPSHFTFQVIETPFSKTGTHPESGARQFGFERNSDGSVTFYTRGVSQADIGITDFLGKYYQNKAWTSAMKGISKELSDRGAELAPSNIKNERCQEK